MPKDFILPSGKTAQIIDGKGKHLFQAQKIAKSPDEITWALLAVLTTIDDKPVIYEDMEEMDLPDLLSILTNSGVGDFLSPAQGILSTSATTPAGDTQKSEE